MADLKLKRINEYKWEIEKDPGLGMNVPGVIFADRELMDLALKENTVQQVINVAGLPGIIKASFAMPDIHYGYGFPIGGVAAMDADNGVISPGGVGYDISCGVRMLRTGLMAADIREKIEDIIYALFYAVPKGVGSKGRIKLSKKQMVDVMTKGVRWAVSNDFGWEEDISFTEENGCMTGADPDDLSSMAFERGMGQVGTLGSGNHFIELQKVSEIFDKKSAETMGLDEGMLTIMIHSGSRGLGHQVCTDYLKIMQKSTFMDDLRLPDRQLACSAIDSSEGKKYFSAMSCAVNYAMVNRHCIAHWVRTVFENILKASSKNLGMDLIYDISHNIARFEDHKIGDKMQRVCVHRKGATRSFGPNHPGIPEKYKKIGQPVIIPGDMGRYSFLLTGTEKAMEESFGSTCHGAGRLMSRSRAKKEINGNQLKQDLLEKKGIIVLAQSISGLAEEAPAAYKDASLVVDVAHKAGLSRKTVKLEPLGVIKG